MSQHRGSLRAGRIAGVEIFLHWTWLIIATLVLLGFFAQLNVEHPDLGDGLAVLLAALGTVVFFGSVLLHELAHALVARARGIEEQGITLYLFGGVTEADASSRTAADELVIAIAGPATSFAIAATLAGAAAAMTGAGDALVDLLNYLAVINVVLAVFNLTPGLPLDGGRVFRAIVWGITGDFRRATRMAAGAGVLVGYGLMGVGLLLLWGGAAGGLWFAAIGWMIAQSARSTEQHDAMRDLFEGLVARDVMTSPVITVPADLTIDDTVDSYFAREDKTTFPVVDGPRIIGLISLDTIRRLSPRQRATMTAGELAPRMKPALVTAPSTPMNEVVDAISAGPGRVLVVENGSIVGIISLSDIIRRSSLASLLDRRPASPTE